MQGKGLIFSRHSPIQEVVSINAVEFEVTLSIAAHKRQEKKQNQGRRQQCCGKLSHANRPYSESRRNSISAVVNSPFRSLRGSECNRDLSSTTARYPRTRHLISFRELRGPPKKSTSAQPSRGSAK